MRRAPSSFTAPKPARAPPERRGTLLQSCPYPASAITYNYAGSYFTHFLEGGLGPQDPTPGGTGYPPAGEYDGTMRVEGSFSIAAPLAGGLVWQDLASSIVSFSFTDGRNVFTDANTSDDGDDFVKLLFSTDAAGGITQWEIRLYNNAGNGQLGDQDHQLHSSAGLGSTGQFDNVDFGRIIECAPPVGVCNTRQDHAWQETTVPFGWSVPEPRSAALLVVGLAALSQGLRRQRG